jgi:hypothetical protein
MIDELQIVIDKYGDQRFGDLEASQQAEYLSAMARKGGIDGATSVLNKLGLDDENAGHDIRDIRDLLRGFRIVRSRAFSTIFSGIGKLVGWIFLLALAGFFIKSESGKALLHVMGD